MSSQIYDYHALCQDIQKINDKIRFVGVINERGRLVTNAQTKNDFLVSQKDDEMLFMELALRVRMRNDFEERIGKVKYSMTVRENHVGMTFPINTDFLYVTTESDINLIELPLQICKTIRDQEKNHSKISTQN